MPRTTVRSEAGGLPAALLWLGRRGEWKKKNEQHAHNSALAEFSLNTFLGQTLPGLVEIENAVEIQSDALEDFRCGTDHAERGAGTTDPANGPASPTES